MTPAQEPVDVNERSLSIDHYLLGLRRRNLAVWKDSEQRWSPIPAAVTPVTVTSHEWQELTIDARQILSCFPVLQSWLQRKEQTELFHLLFGRLAPIELEGAKADPATNWGHATIRFDLFWHGNDLKVIEANCTIPAMQAYSDLILSAWLEASTNKNKNKQKIHLNTDELLESLLALYHRDGGTAKRPNIAILHRPGDSQLAELSHYETNWSARAHSKVSAFRVHPDHLQKVGNSIIDAPSKRSIDLIYRHCFAWRLNDHSILSDALLNHCSAHIYNPLSAHYEVKGFFALLSYVCQDQALGKSIGLTSAQIKSVQRRVPKTRLIAKSLSKKFSESLDMDANTFAANLDQYVVKNSLGYGGHQVFMGSEWTTPESQTRLRKLLSLPGSVEISGQDFLQWIQNESPDAWIIQDRMSGRRHKTKIINSDDSISEIDGYVDASIFLNTGTSDICSGGVSRIAKGPIVNIGVGGGLAPFLVV